MRKLEFLADSGLRLEVQEIDKNRNVFICPAQYLDAHPWHGARRVVKYKVNVEYEVIPILEVRHDALP